MKKIGIFTVIFCMILSCLAQNGKSGQTNQGKETAQQLQKDLQTLESTIKEMQDRIAELESQQNFTSNTANPTINGTNSNYEERLANLSNQFNTLLQDIDADYQSYLKSDLYKKLYAGDKDKTFNEISETIRALEIKRQTLPSSIDSLEARQKWVNEVRNYYSSTNIDVLYAHADLVSLSIHKQILGNNCPSVINELQVLLECAELIKNPYNAVQNSQGRKNLQGVRQCERKDYLLGLLDIYDMVSANVDTWINDKKCSLSDFITFYNYLQGEYGIDLDKDFPFLAERVRKAVVLPSQNK